MSRPQLLTPLGAQDPVSSGPIPSVTSRASDDESALENGLHSPPGSQGQPFQTGLDGEGADFTFSVRTCPCTLQK